MYRAENNRKLYVEGIAAITRPVSYKERRYSWEKRIEEIIIEMSEEKCANGLAINIDWEGLAGEFRKMTDHIETAKKHSKENPSIARIIPGDRLNEE